MIRELQTLLVVAKTGSFAAAGDQIGLTQGAVSLQMRRLEEHLGLTLFERSGRSARLNASGRQVVERSAAILELWQQLGRDEGEQGHLRVGAIASVHSGLIPMLARFRERWPQVTLRVVPGVSLNLLGQVDSGELDLAVMIRPPFELPLELTWQTLRREPVRLLLPQSRANQFSSVNEALTALPFIHCKPLKEPSFWTMMLSWPGRCGRSVY